jgi:hypothetical protein
MRTIVVLIPATVTAVGPVSSPRARHCQNREVQRGQIEPTGRSWPIAWPERFHSAQVSARPRPREHHKFKTMIRCEAPLRNRADQRRGATTGASSISLWQEEYDKIGE